MPCGASEPKAMLLLSKRLRAQGLETISEIRGATTCRIHDVLCIYMCIYVDVYVIMCLWVSVSLYHE